MFSSTILWMTVFDEAIVTIMPIRLSQAGSKSSTLLDIEKPIILDKINGAIARFLKSIGVLFDANAVLGQCSDSGSSIRIRKSVKFREEYLWPLQEEERCKAFRKYSQATIKYCFYRN